MSHELDHMTKATGLSRWLWLSATLSRAKASAGPSPMAWPGPAQTGPAWPGSRLWAGPGKSLLKPDKCEFEKTKVEYLGVIISHNSIEMDPVKIAGVTEWPTPTSKKEVQSFLGFTNFYRQFIRDFSHHARPLFDLTKNDVKWHWSTKEQSAFDALKGQITSAPILSSPDNSSPFRIEADSSDFATGAVLSQQSTEAPGSVLVKIPVLRGTELRDS
jgi:hypothetical protein